MPQPVSQELPAFAAVYDEHFPFVWRNLRRLGVPERALRDATQDAFLVVHRRLGEYAGRGSLRAWLYSIVRRVASDYRRQQRRKGIAAADSTERLVDPTEPGPEQRLLRGEALERLVELLGVLDADKRDVLVLVDLEDLSVVEAATALTINVNTAYARLRAAREVLRGALAKRGAEEDLP